MPMRPLGLILILALSCPSAWAQGLCLGDPKKFLGCEAPTWNFLDDRRIWANVSDRTIRYVGTTVEVTWAVPPMTVMVERKPYPAFVVTWDGLPVGGPMDLSTARTVARDKGDSIMAGRAR